MESMELMIPCDEFLGSIWENANEIHPNYLHDRRYSSATSAIRFLAIRLRYSGHRRSSRTTFVHRLHHGHHQVLDHSTQGSQSHSHVGHDQYWIIFDLFRQLSSSESECCRKARELSVTDSFRFRVVCTKSKWIICRSKWKNPPEKHRKSMQSRTCESSSRSIIK